MIPRLLNAMTRDFNKPHLEQDISTRDKEKLKRVVKAIRKNIDRKPFMKKDKGTSDKATNYTCYNEKGSH